MRRLALVMLVLVLSVPSRAAAQALEPSYSRGGFDYFSAPIEPPQTRTVPTQCEVQLGKHTEVLKLETTWRCSVTTLSEPRLSTKLNEEIALADQFDEARRAKVVSTLIDKYKRLAQCPAGTEAFHDGTMYWCVKNFTAKELCPSGAPSTLDSGEIGCVISSCAKGFLELGALTHGEHPGCFKCPRGSFDPKETDAFHGALKGMPAAFTDVFCRAPAK